MGDTLMEPASPEHKWIAPLAEELKLPRNRSGRYDPAAVWARLKEHDVPERVRRAVVRLNREMNDDSLEYLDYLPPQASVLQVVYRPKGRVLVMELVLREHGPKAVFYRQKFRSPLRRYLAGGYRYRSHFNVAWARRFQPEELADAEIQEWFSFLLSGFKRKPTGARDEKASKGWIARVRALRGA